MYLSGCGSVFRLTALTAMVVAMAMSSGGCRSARNAVTAKSESEDGNIWRLSNGKILLLVDAQKGRIMHYGLRNSPMGLRINQNVLWTNPEAADPKYSIGGWTNWGGDKVWPWPQKTGQKYADAWNWPPPEPGPYKVERTEDRQGLIMTSGEIPGFGLRVVRKIEINEETTSVTVTTAFERVRDTFGKPVGAWSITQVPTPKNCYVRVPLVSDRTRLLSAADGFRKRATGSVVELKVDPSASAKAFADADVIAAVYDDVVLLQRQIPAHREGQWNADERAQVYAHPSKAPNMPEGPSYYELEWTSPVLPPNQVENTALKVIYKLIPIERETTPETIIEMIQKLP